MEALPPAGTYRRLLRSLAPYRATAVAAIVAASIAAAATAFYAYLIGPALKALLLESPVARVTWIFPATMVGVALMKAGAQWLQGGSCSRSGNA